MGETIGQAVHPLRCLRSAARVAESQSSHHAIPGTMRSANDARSKDDEGSQASNNALLIHEFARRSGAWSWCRVFSMRRGRCQIRAAHQTVRLLQAALTNIIRNRSHIEKKADIPGRGLPRIFGNAHLSSAVATVAEHGCPTIWIRRSIYSTCSTATTLSARRPFAVCCNGCRAGASLAITPAASCSHGHP